VWQIQKASFLQLILETVAGTVTGVVTVPFRVVCQERKFKHFRTPTQILPVVLYGCESWSLTLREESRLRVFENRVLRRIFAPKRDEVTGEWRRLNTENFMLCTPHHISFG
jgi:hypothetical protein